MSRLAAPYLAALAMLFAPRLAGAHELLDNDQLKLSVGGFIQGGYSLSDAPAAGLEHGPFLGLLRAVAEARHKRWGRAFIQVGADSGQLELLDAIAELTPVRPLTLRFGRFKTPTSVNYLIFGPLTPFVNRPYVVELGYVQKRLIGGEAIGAIDGLWGKASLQVGLFAPSSEVRERLPDGDGEFLSVRALLELKLGLGLHLAYLDLLGADNRPTPPAPGAVPVRPVEFDRQLDAAIIYKAHRFTGYLEGVVVLDEPGGYRPFSVYAALLKDFPIPYREVSLEPGLRYEVARKDARWLQRLTANLTFYAIGDYLNVSANYELLIDADVVGHAGYARLQGGF